MATSSRTALSVHDSGDAFRAQAEALDDETALSSEAEPIGLGLFDDLAWDWIDETSSEPAPQSTPASGPRVRFRGQVVVLLPALNEEPAIGSVLDRVPIGTLRALGYDVEVWVVDGQSTDRTMVVAREKGARTYVQRGSGKGNGVRQALDHILAQLPPGIGPGHRVFIMLDADGTYRAEDIPMFAEALESGAEVVLGTRLQGSIADGAISDMNRLGNRLLSRLASLLFHAPVTDVCTGMWGFREDVLETFGLVANGFDLEADLFASASERGIRVHEIPIAYDCRIGEPKLVPLRTGIAIAWRLLMRRLNRPPIESHRIRPSSAANREESA